MTRKSIVPLAAAAAVAALAAPMFAQAQDYGYYEHQEWCTGRIHDNGVAGTLLGGAAGAVLGSNLAGHGGRTGGALLGAAAGAALGSNVARSSTKYRCRGPRDVGYYYAPPPRPVYYYAPPPRPVYVAPEPVYMAPPPPPHTYYGYGAYYEDGPRDGEWRHHWREHHYHHEHDEDDGD